MDNEKLLDRIHALETAQAAQSATTAGMEATQGAVQAGNMATTTAMNAHDDDDGGRQCRARRRHLPGHRPPSLTRERPHGGPAGSAARGPNPN